MRSLIKVKTESNIVYIDKKPKDAMDLRCCMCGTIKNEIQIEVENGLYKCICGSSSFIPLVDLEELEM